MNVGALVITAGRNGAAMIPVGKLSAGQRMAALFQKIGADIVAVVTGADDKPLEKQLSQSGVLLFPFEETGDREDCARAGLNYLCGKCERVFLLDEDRPLVLPDTLRKMLCCRGEMIVPTYEGKPGKPVLLSAGAVRKTLNQARPKLNTVYVPVEDEAVLLPAGDCARLTERIEAHDLMITRATLDMSICRGKQIIDKKLVSLLYFVRETQSVRDACGRMQVSYSTAWNMLNHAEAELGYALVSRNKGGASGSGTVLTEKGEKLLDAYIEFEARLSSNAQQLFERLFQNL